MLKQKFNYKNMICGGVSTAVSISYTTNKARTKTKLKVIVKSAKIKTFKDVESVTAATTIQNLKFQGMEVKEYLLVVGVCSLLFLGIPVRINNSSKDDENLFKDYIRKFNKSYNENDTEYLIRLKNFKNSLRIIEELNRNRSGDQNALYGLTTFSDLSQDEFFRNRLQKSTFKLLKQSNCSNHLKCTFRRNSHERLKRSNSIPMRVDWREKGIIGSIHNQGSCGACWAFSTVETVEAMNALKVGSLTELSVQEAIDCAQFGNYGCEGGDSCSLLDWLVATKTKLTSDKLYPFNYKTGICKIKKPKTGVQIKSFSCDNFVGAEDLLQQEIAFHGPVAAAVNAINWQFYLGGIIQYHCKGEPKDLNHAIQIVGYDRTGPVPYYIVRNSWGIEFGNKGYLYIAIGQNTCGLANEVTSLDVL